MKFKIHWSKDGVEDSILICGSSVEECREIVRKEMDKRGLDEILNNCWSEEIKD